MWRCGAANWSDLRPIATPDDFVNYLVSLSRASDNNRIVTTFPCALFFWKMPKLTGNTVFKKMREFQRLYGDKLNGILENVLLIPGQEASPPSRLEGLALLRKNEQLSTSLRNKGNDFFKAGNVPKALHCYTLAASYAQPGSHAEKLSYSNRSACFAHLGNWKKCLEEIILFEKIESGVEANPSLLERIEARKVKCQDQLRATQTIEVKVDEDKQFAQQVLATLKNESKQIPGAEEFVGIRMDAVKGRCLYNKGDTPIEPGTLILMDKADHHVPAETVSFNTNNCSACSGRLYGGGIPCSTCVFTLYCSETCAASDYAKLHSKYECKMLPYLHELKEDSSNRLGLAMLLKLGPRGLLAHLRAPKHDEKSPIPGMNSEGVFAPTALETVQNMSWNLSPNFHRNILVGFCCHALLATKVLDACTDYFTSLKETEPGINLAWVKEEFYKQLVLHQLTAAFSSALIRRFDTGLEGSKKNGSKNDTMLGRGLFLLCTLLNHSCDPNTVCSGLPGNGIMVVTTHLVAPGQEFFTLYGLSAASLKEERQQKLETGCGFHCTCPKCKYDWSHVLRGDPICPECRPFRDVDSNGIETLQEIILKETRGGWSCPVCPWHVTGWDFERDCERIAQLAEAASSKLKGRRRELKAAFLGLQECIKFHDLHFMKPDSIACSSSRLQLKDAVVSLAEKLWD